MSGGSGQERLAVAFQTQILGAGVVVEDVEMTEDRIMAICSRGRFRQAVPIRKVPLPAPPQGSGWVEVYRFWLGGGRGM